MAAIKAQTIDDALQRVIRGFCSVSVPLELGSLTGSVGPGTWVREYFRCFASRSAVRVDAI